MRVGKPNPRALSTLQIGSRRQSRPRFADPRLLHPTFHFHN
jgi:hypothetical protein